MAAANCLGVSDIEIWDYDDYPIEVSRQLSDRLVETIRHMRPDVIVTHDKFDVMNPDHNAVSQLVFACSVQSNSVGVRIEDTAATKQMKLFGFEPHQTELSHFVPGSFIDITETYEKKVNAMNCFQAQQHLIEIYKQRAFLRGNHARRLSGVQQYQYAECFANYFPVVGDEFY